MGFFPQLAYAVHLHEHYFDTLESKIIEVLKYLWICMKKYDIDSGCVVGIFADDGRKFKSIYSEQKIMTKEEFENALAKAKHVSKIAYM